MPSFFDIEFSEIVPIGEYVARIDDNEELLLAVDLLADANAYLDFLFATRQIRCIPDVRVRIGWGMNAEGIDGVVILGSQLFEYAMRGPGLSVGQVENLGAQLGIARPDFWLRSNFLNWVLSHELTHAHRKHEEVLKSVGIDALARQAIELDADLCAVAHVFRWRQTLTSAQIDPRHIKCFVFRSIFSAMREFPNPEPGSGHHNTVHRLLEMSTKLATLRANPTDPADTDLKTDESLQALESLLNLVAELETERAKSLGLDPRASLSEIVEFYRREDWRPLSERWEEIRTEVARISRTSA